MPHMEVSFKYRSSDQQEWHESPVYRCRKVMVDRPPTEGQPEGSWRAWAPGPNISLYIEGIESD